jgi:hypothetical protein
MIELQHCSSCRRRFVGPDCRDLGLFNFNNHILFTHDLLEEYTSAYTTSETPFVAWVAVVSRRYQNHSSESRFVTEQMFRAVWFSYAKLLHLEGDMRCPQCGPSPENTIWDGVTLAFNRKHLLPTLQPPTVLHEDSILREKAHYLGCQQLLSDKALRKLMRKVLTGPSLVLAGSPVSDQSNVTTEEAVGVEGEGIGGGDDDDDGDIEGYLQRVVGRRERTAKDRAKEDLFSRLEVIPSVHTKLLLVDTGLAEVFDRHYRLRTVTSVPVPGVYSRLFMQVRAMHSLNLPS